MSGNEARNDLRRLLAESGVEETPELIDALIRLQEAGTGTAPEPHGELAELLDSPPRLRSVDGPKGAPRRRPRRGFLLTAALIGAMAAGTSGVAATLRDHQVTADVADTASQLPLMEQVPGVDQAEGAGEAAGTSAADASAAPAPGGSASAGQAEEPGSQPAPAPVETAPVQPAPEAPETTGPAPAPAPGEPDRGASVRPGGAGQGPALRPGGTGQGPDRSGRGEGGGPYGPDRIPGAGQRPDHAADHGNAGRPGSRDTDHRQGPGSSWTDPGAAKGPRSPQENRGGVRQSEVGPPEHSAVYGGRSGLGR